MPLSPSAPRKPAHTRKIICDGYLRDDGLWDIEAHLTDTRAFSYRTEWRGEVTPGTPAHEMWLRWTVGNDLVIRAIEVVTDFGPFPSFCPQVASNYQRLVGANIGKGFIKEVQARIGRTEGCTHLFALIQAAGNSTMQTLAGRVWQGVAGSDDNVVSIFGPASDRPALLNSCHSYASDSPVVKKIWPAYYTGNDKN